MSIKYILSFILLIQLCFAQTVEHCSNALDDDQDGLTDLQDPDCACEGPLIPSPIPNPSFEDHSCCPDAQAQLNCADFWIDASEPTPDYFHMCGWQDFPSYQVPLPLPDGEGFIGFRNGQFEGAVLEPGWKEYVGACLNYPLLPGQLYQFSMYVGFGDDRHSPPLEFTFWGAESCDDLPFGVGDPAFGCPEKIGTWHRLAHTNIDGDREWIRIEFEIEPEVKIESIALGPGCQDSMAKPNPYYFLDHIVLLEGVEVEGEISLLGHPCATDARLMVRPNMDFSPQVPIRFQWYKDGIALVGETGNVITRLYGNGVYQVRFLDVNGDCALSSEYVYEKPETFVESQFAICEGGSYLLGDKLLVEEGIYLDTLQTPQACDSIVLLDLQVKSELADTVIAKIFPPESYQVGTQRFDRPGDYEILLSSAQGCDSTVFLQLSHYQLFVPTAFSPNGDGINEQFSIVGGEEVVSIRSLKIFNRWGNLIHEAEGISPSPQSAGWNGQAKGRPAAEGLYVFVASVLFDDGKERMSSGSFVLMR